VSSSLSTILIVILDDSLTIVVPRYQVTAGLGFALHLHLIVISVPVSFGIILGFSTKDGANPAASSPPWKFSAILALLSPKLLKALHL